MGASAATTSDLLGRSLDYGETLATVARLAVPEHADWCCVEMPRADGSLERVAIEPAGPAAGVLDLAVPLGSAEVIRTGEPELAHELPDALRELGFVSTLIVPLRVRGTVIGGLALATAQSGRRFEAADVEDAQELADRCALALDNARLHTSLREAEAATRESRDAPAARRRDPPARGGAGRRGGAHAAGDGLAVSSRFPR